MRQQRKIFLLAASLMVACFVAIDLARAERDQDQDDFDDSGFDDSGYNNPQNHDAEGSNHNPSSYSPSSDEDLDDDDDVDESNVVAKVAEHPQRRSYSPINSIVLPSLAENKRQKREIQEESDVEIVSNKDSDSAQPLIRNKRHLYKKKKYYMGPVYTYVKTNKHAHYKWGVKHKVGKHYG